jgi:hypothetical protein
VFIRVWRVVRIVGCLSVLAATVQGAELPIPRGSEQGLPPGAASEAPEQQSGSADSRHLGGSTVTNLRSAKRKPPRPPGAVADRLPAPALAAPKPQRQQRLTNVRTRQSQRPPRAFNPKTSKELPAQRSATVREFQNEDGTRTRRVYSQPVNAQRPDGSWAPIDLDLTAGGGRIMPKLAPYQVSFAPTAAEGKLAAVTLDGAHEVAFGLRGAAATSGQVSGERVDYAKVRPDADLRLSATANGLKEAIVLRSADAPTMYDFDLRLRGLTPALNEPVGDIALSDAKGAVRANGRGGSDHPGGQGQGGAARSR